MTRAAACAHHTHFGASRAGYFFQTRQLRPSGKRGETGYDRNNRTNRHRKIHPHPGLAAQLPKELVAPGRGCRPDGRRGDHSPGHGLRYHCRAATRGRPVYRPDPDADLCPDGHIADAQLQCDVDHRDVDRLHVGEVDPRDGGRECAAKIAEIQEFNPRESRGQRNSGTGVVVVRRVECVVARQPVSRIPILERRELRQERSRRQCLEI